MSNKPQKKSSNRPATKVPKKKTSLLPILAVAAVAMCVVVVFLVNGSGITKDSDDIGSKVNGSDSVVSDETQIDNNGTDSENSGAVTISSGESLVIPTADITTDAYFYPIEVDGTNMEVIAVKDSAGNIRTAFNTCQICYGSGRGYYVQSGNFLVCQNCGNRFSMDQVEIESGGCNPWPIFDKNKTVSADEISISYDFLAESERIFANWKGNY